MVASCALTLFTDAHLELIIAGAIVLAVTSLKPAGVILAAVVRDAAARSNATD